MAYGSYSSSQIEHKMRPPSHFPNPTPNTTPKPLPSIFLLLPIRSRTSTPRPPTLRRPYPPAPHLLPLLRRRRPHKREIRRYRLIKQLSIIGALDRGFGFFLRGVFDQSVAL